MPTSNLSIPIQNLYYIFCYAWNKVEQGNIANLSSVQSPELTELLAKVLADGIKHIHRRGLDRGYIPIRDDLLLLRGRIVVQKTLLNRARRTQRTACDFDDLSIDISSNQIIKATLQRLLRNKKLAKAISDELKYCLNILKNVSYIRLSPQEFAKVQIYRHNSFYSFLLSICELVFDSMLPEEDDGICHFTQLLRDEKSMRLVFQEFVKNFLRIEQKEFRVTPLQMRWDAKVLQHSDGNRLPVMTTDIHLKSATRHVIIDTKYYRDSLQRNRGKASIHSDHLYQLFSYLKNSEALGPEYSNCEGILLYPTVTDELDSIYEIQGHRVRVATISLNQPWQQIKSELLAIVA